MLVTASCVAVPEAATAPPASSVSPTPELSSPRAEPTSDPDRAPAPEPTRPPFESLVVTTEGLGSLKLGETIDENPASAMVQFDPDFCAEEFGETARSERELGRWLPHPDYPVQSGTAMGEAFAPAVSDTKVFLGAEIWHPALRTPEGIGIGSTRAEIEAAYPNAETTDFLHTRVYVISGSTGELHLEVAVAHSDGDSYWRPDRIDKAFLFGLQRPGGAPMSNSGTDNTILFCG